MLKKWFHLALFTSLLIPASTWFSTYNQSIVTTTTSQTITTQLVSVSTITNYSRLIFTVNYLTMTTDSYSVNFDPVSRSGACRYLNLKFSGSKGETVAYTGASSSPVKFYILTDDQFNTWSHSMVCPVLESLYRQEDSIFFNGTFVVPANGDFDFLIYNDSTTSGAHVNFYASISILSSSAITLTATQTQSHVVVTTATTIADFISQDLPLLVVLGFFVIILRSLYRSRSRRRTVEKTIIY